MNKFKAIENVYIYMMFTNKEHHFSVERRDNLEQ